MNVTFSFELDLPEDVDLDKLQKEIERALWRADRCYEILPFHNRDELSDPIWYQVENTISYTKE